MKAYKMFLLHDYPLVSIVSILVLTCYAGLPDGFFFPLNPFAHSYNPNKLPSGSHCDG